MTWPKCHFFGKVPTSGSGNTITHKVHSGNAEQCRCRNWVGLSTRTPVTLTDSTLYVAVHVKPEDKPIVSVTTPMQGFEYNASYPLWDKGLLINFTLYKILS